MDLITDAPGGPAVLPHQLHLQRNLKAYEEYPQDSLETTTSVDAAFLRGVAEVHQKVVRKNALEAARKAIFVLDDVLP